MEFRILGPLEVVAGDRPLPLTGGRERALLTLLLISANRVVSAERLTEELWVGHPPEQAAAALRVFVSRLRKVLREGGGEDVVVTRPPGYVAEVDPFALDAHQFEALVAEGRERAAGGLQEEAAERLRAALALWRGPALSDVVESPMGRAEAARLEEGRLTALEERVECDLGCGRHGRLVAELDALTKEHPLRERLWGQRMMALYRAGRQADALRVYQELRTLLGEELGLEPSAAVAALERAILRHDPALDWLPAGQPESAASSAAAPAGVSGVVTFLFTDLIGSTELFDRLGDDAAEQLIRTHFNLLRGVVAEAGGEVVKTLGDGLMVAFTSPLAALRCAVAMQDAMAEHTRSRPGEAFMVRVGLHAGEPVRGEDDFFGTAVIVARRLCDLAQGGQILASEIVARLIGVRDGFRFTTLGPLALKGIAEAVPAVEVGRAAAGEETAEPGGASADDGAPVRIPMPSLLTEIGRVFVGREPELQRLEQLWKDAAAGEFRLAVVAGEPGVGKTRLAAELAVNVHHEGAAVLAGRCDEDLGVPYQPFVEALRHFVNHTPTALLPQRLGRYGGELVRLVPELADRVKNLPAPLHSDPETERYRLFDAVAAWLAAAADGPLLLVLDDLQWATKPTVLLLRHVVRSTEVQRLFVLGTYRDTDLGHGHPLGEVLADLRRESKVERLSVTGLDRSAVGAFLEQAAGHELGDEVVDLARAIHDETEGNPFFVREVVRHLTEIGAIEQQEGRWAARLPMEELGIPESVREVVGRRISRLSEEADRALRVAAVVGAQFDLRVVEAAGRIDEDSLFSSLEEASTARLVIEAGDGQRYRFTHALVRDTLYGELSAARRVALHRRVAEAIETVHTGRLDDQLPALAHHWARASAPAADTARAIDYAARAGDRALAQLAHDEAASYYRQALELLAVAEDVSDDGRRVELLIGLGEAQRRAGDRAHRETLLEAARLAADRGDADAQARAVLANTRGVWPTAIGATDHERVAALEAALAVARPGDSPTRARLLAALGMELTYMVDPERRVHLADEALAIARICGDAATLAHVLLHRFFTIPAASTLPERLANSAELIPLAESLGDPGITAGALLQRARSLIEAGDIEGADRALERAERLADDLAQPTLRWLVGHVATVRAIIAGDFEESERRAQAGFELGQASGQGDAPLILAAFLFLIRFDQGQLGDLELELLAKRAAAVPDLLSGPALLAVILCELDRVDEATEHYERVVGLLDDLPVDTQWMLVVPYCAMVCAQLGDRPRARLFFDLLAPCASEVMFGAFVAAGAKTHYLAVLATTLADFDEAERRFAEAATTHERIGAPHWLARTRLEWARMLFRRGRPGDPERARELLDLVLTVARERGLANIERRAVQLLT